MTRKIIQIAAAGVENNAGTQCNAYVFALCNDGTLWGQRDNGNEWFQYPEIPQPKSEHGSNEQ